MPTSLLKKKARIAGLLYLVVVLSGMYSLAYVPSKLIVWDNPSLTVHNITSFERLFRYGIVSGLICYTFFLFLPIALYKLLKSVNEKYAKMMVLLAVVSVPITFINMQNKFAVLSIIDNSDYLKVLTAGQLQSTILFYLHLFDNGLLIVSIFWGLWLFPFGCLVYKSGFLPKILGVFLILGCLGYLIQFLGHLLFPNYANMDISTYIRLPASIGEIGTCLWLLIFGVKEKSSKKPD